MYKKELKKIPRLVQKIYGWFLSRAFPRYHPIFVNGNLITDNDRASTDRWEMIEPHVARGSTFLDLGCAEGFFVLSAAKEKECIALGIDADIRRLALAEQQLINEKIDSAGFMYAEMDIDFLKRMPKFDVILFMSVLHHMIRENGIDYSLEFMKLLRTKTNQSLFFETGLSMENIPAAAGLPDMKNPDKWIKDFLSKAGWSKIEKIGKSLSYGKDVERGIYKVNP